MGTDEWCSSWECTRMGDIDEDSAAGRIVSTVCLYYATQEVIN